MTQQNTVHLDHSWASPLRLTRSELSHALHSASLSLGMQLDLSEPALRGRSGAAVYALGCAHDEKYFMRVTSARRAHRERFVVQRIESARDLWPDENGLRVVEVPRIQREYPVAVTLARYIEGDSVESADLGGLACLQFSSLFESTPASVGTACPKSVVRLLSWLVSRWPSGDPRPKAALMLSVRQDWRCVVGHGDPSYDNLLRTNDGLVPVDFAGGGILPVRTHRARWVNAVHWRNGEQGQCRYCITVEEDRMALLVDACRRLRSDAGDDAREGIWFSRVDALLDDPA